MTEHHFKTALSGRTNPTFFKDPDSNTEIAVGRNGTSEDCTDVFLGIHMHWGPADNGEGWAKLDANELRDAINKAVGPREPERVFHYYPAPDGITPPAERVSLDDAAWKPLGWTTQDGITLNEPEPAKPYRPIDRDRLLRHIEDIEATLTRRNRRHEEDQEKIREVLEQNERLMERVEELEEIAMRRGDEIDELEAKLAAPSSEEQLERLSVGLEAKLNPPRLLDTHDSKGKGIPAIEVERVVAANEDPYSRSFRFYEAGDDFGWWGRAEEVLALGLSAEDFKPFDPRRKKYEEQGLEPWEIEILMGANA